MKIGFTNDRVLDGIIFNTAKDLVKLVIKNMAFDNKLIKAEKENFRRRGYKSMMVLKVALFKVEGHKVNVRTAMHFTDNTKEINARSMAYGNRFYSYAKGRLYPPVKVDKKIVMYGHDSNRNIIGCMIFTEGYVL